MSEYIVTEFDLTSTEWISEYEQIVRCRDCKHCYADDSVWMCAQLDFGIDYITSDEKPYGFCAWGERGSLWVTCKCGEEIELGEREDAICPSCGRMVRYDS